MRLFLTRFFKATFIFVIVITIIQIGISIFIKGKTINGHDNLDMTANVNRDLIFLGSSRCRAHFDPSFFDSAFNLKSVNIGVDGHSEITMAIIRLKTYLSVNNPPKFAVLTIDPFVGPGNENNNTNFVHKNDFARYAFFPSKNEQLIVNYFQFNIYEQKIPLYAIFKYKILSNCFWHTGNIYLKYGYDLHEESWDTLTNPVTDKAQKLFFKSDETDSITQALKNLDELCRKNKIKLLCIQTPVYKTCYNDTIFKKIRYICNQANVPFIDVNKESISNDITCFYNSNHLNKTGVEKMNAEILKDSVFQKNLKR
jgi:hypothetical protein